MSDHDEEAVKSALEEHHNKIRTIVHKAWSEVADVAEYRSRQGYAQVRYPRTVANNVFDAIANYAHSEFSSDENVKVIVEPQTIKVLFNGRQHDGIKVVGRFKKGDEEHLGRNICTQAVLNFTDEQLCLPGFEDAKKVEFVWLPNDIGTKIGKVLVVARDLRKVVWEYEIAEADEGGVVIPLAPTPQDDTDGSLITPKRPDVAKDEGQ